MKDILITSSVLIVALLVLRQIFRKTISRRVQYALWALVLVRLLVPVSLLALEHNVLTATESIETGVSEQLENVSVYLNPVAQAEVTRSTIASPDITTPAVVVRDRTSVAVHEYDYKVRGYSADATITSEDGTHVTWYAKALTITEMLSYVWYAGIIVMICWLLISNFRFWRNLCKARIPYMIDGCKRTVYLVESGLSSPCLFGLFRPAIYLNSAAVETKETLRHVIAHETTHARHLDPLWSLLRSVCLVIYWFDPLVWAAAFVSRTDCELACDEGAMKRLGDEERLSYGQTLLSLIPVRHGGTNPLLSATTMTSDKKRLKDRITRIAENRQTVAAALFLVLAAVVLVCAVTFTGAKESQEEELIDDPITTLSGDELAWFNEEFFKAAIYEGDTSYINIRNQFLSSHYERPEDIDLYELFYCGTGTDELVSDAELEIVGAFYTDGTQVCPTTKMSVSAMDAVLLTYTGLTVAETNKIDLECFPYLEEYDAYYHTHGDTNYRSGVTITSGEREGDLIHLYYNDSFFGDGWKCVTLQDKGNNNYWFVSNLPSEQPVISVALPSDEPCLTIPLSDLEPSVPQEVEVTLASCDCAEWGYGIRLDNNIHIRPYLSTDGNIYAAIIYESAVENGQMTEWEAGRFFTYPTYPNWDEPELKNCQLEPFSDLFGCSGVIVSYNDYITGDPEQGGIYGPCYNYYAFSEDGTPLLLARTTEHSQIVDMDGDGTFELLGNRQLFFKRDAVVYEADIVSLLQEAWPELLFWDFSFININRRCLIVSGMASMPEWGENASTSFLRDIYFDGENLQVYADLPGTTDHVSNNVPGNYPEDVYAAAKAQVLDAYIATKNGADGALSDQSFDDWRVSGLSTVETAYPYPDVELDIYTLSYQFHSADPGNVMLAGGTYVQEDGWVGGFYSEESPYLLFHVLEDGSRVLLESYIAGDCSTDSIMFHGYLSRTLVKNGLIIPSDISGKNHLYMFYDNQFVYLNELAEFNSSEQLSALQSLAQYCTNPSDENHIQMFQQGLDNLKWDAMKETSALTESGKNTYQLLLDILDGNGHVESEEDTEDVQVAAVSEHLTGYSLGIEQHGTDYESAISYLDSYMAGWSSTEEMDAGNFQSCHYTKGDSHMLYLILEDGRTARLPLPYFDSAMRYAEPQELHIDLNQNTYSYQAEVPHQVRSMHTGSVMAEAGNYHYIIDLENLTCLITFTPAESDPAAADTGLAYEYQDMYLVSQKSKRSYSELIAWVTGPEPDPREVGFEFVPTGDYWEDGNGHVVYIGSWWGTPHLNQYGMVIQFPDDTEATLPLPSDYGFVTYLPTSQSFSENTFIYEIAEDTRTYRYTVNLQAKTVSLNVI